MGQIAVNQASPAQLVGTSKVIHSEKPAVAAAPAEKKPQMASDSVKLQSRPVSKVITISGGAFTGSIIGGATGGILMGAGDLFLGGAQSLKAATTAGAGIGATAGFVSGAVIANMTDSKLKATLYGSLAGAGLGALSGGAAFKNLPAAAISGAIGAVSGGVSAFTTSHLLGK